MSSNRSRQRAFISDLSDDVNAIIRTSDALEQKSEAEIHESMTQIIAASEARPALLLIDDDLHGNVGANEVLTMYVVGHLISSPLWSHSQGSYLIPDNYGWRGACNAITIHGSVIVDSLAIPEYTPAHECPATIGLFGHGLRIGILMGGFGVHALGPDGISHAYPLARLSTTKLRFVDTDSLAYGQITEQAKRKIAEMVRGCPKWIKRREEWLMTEAKRLMAEANDEDESGESKMTNDVEFIETWRDNRECKTLDVAEHREVYFHEYIRCSECNGEVEILLPQQRPKPPHERSKGKCPHCKQPSMLKKEFLDGLYGGGE